MAFSRFEEIIAWQKGQDLAVIIYLQFGKNRDFGFRDQICRASVSISNNIAEGYERNSNADFKRFLHISLGSTSELKSMLYLAQKLGYINPETLNNMIAQSEEVSKLLKGLIKSLKK